MMPYNKLCNSRVIEVLEDLPHGDSANEEEEDEAAETEEVRWGDPQYKLQVERVQLRNQELQNTCTQNVNNLSVVREHISTLYVAIMSEICLLQEQI